MPRFDPCGPEPKHSSPRRSFLDRSVWWLQDDRPCRKSLCARRESDSLLSYANRCRGLAHGDECRPIEWAHLAILGEQVYLCVSQSRARIFALSQVTVELSHQRTGERIVCAPETRYNRFRPGHQKCFHQVADALLPLQFPNPTVTSRKRREFGIQSQSYDLPHLQQTVITRLWVRTQHQR